MNMQLFKNIFGIEKVNFDLTFNFRASEWHKMYKRSKRLLEYVKTGGLNDKTEELARCIKEDIIGLIGSLKAIRKMKDKGLITEAEFNELKNYLDK